MKKIFTLISMAFVAMSMNAQTDDQGHAAGKYPVKSVVWKSITWTNGNNKKDKDNNDMLFLMGTGNGYATLIADYYYDDNKSEWLTRPDYTYIDYEKGATGIPAYGLYYSFTPAVSGALKICVWVNKGGDNRKTFVVKASDGKPLTPFVDYTFDGYVNGQNQDGTSIPKYFDKDAFKTRHDGQYVKDGVDTQPYKLSENGQAVWGWITLDVSAGETYVVYQQSSQLGFGGYDFTPAGGATESYIAALDMGGTIMLNTEFSSIVKDGEDKDGNPVYINDDSSKGLQPGVAQNVTDEGSVVKFGTANMSVKAVGGAEPRSLEPDFDATGISNVKVAEDANAPVYNLAGQKADKNQKGILIQNGKKFVNK